MLKLFARKQVDPKAQLKEVFGGYSLPTFPAVYLEALQQIRDSDSTAATLADVLASDPGVTMRLLGTVNSAAFGLRSPVKSVHHAVSMLGRSHIESMLISLASHSALPADQCDGFEPDRTASGSRRRVARRRRGHWQTGSTPRNAPSVSRPRSSLTWRFPCCALGRGRSTPGFSNDGTRARASFQRWNMRRSVGTTRRSRP